MRLEDRASQRSLKVEEKKKEKAEWSKGSKINQSDVKKRNVDDEWESAGSKMKWFELKEKED